MLNKYKNTDFVPEIPHLSVKNWRPVHKVHGLKQLKRLSKMSLHSFFLVELVLLLCIPLCFLPFELPHVSHLPELFGKPWFVVAAHVNAN